MDIGKYLNVAIHFLSWMNLKVSLTLATTFLFVAIVPVCSTAESMVPLMILPAAWLTFDVISSLVPEVIVEGRW